MQKQPSFRSSQLMASVVRFPTWRCRHGLGQSLRNLPLWVSLTTPSAPYFHPKLAASRTLLVHLTVAGTKSGRVNARTASWVTGRVRCFSTTPLLTADAAGQALKQCMQGVKENDKTQYDVIALCPDQYKSGLFALYAFNNEVNAAVAKASDPKFALMRLQWWKDTCMSLQNIGRHNSVPENAGGGVGGGGSGGVDVRANLEQQPSVIQALAVLAMHRPGRIDFDWLSRVVEAKQTLLAGEGMTVEGMEDLLTRADNSYGALLHLSMAYMNVNDQPSHEAAHQLGRHLALTSLLQNIAEDASKGNVFIPVALLSKHGLKANDILNLYDISVDDERKKRGGDGHPAGTPARADAPATSNTTVVAAMSSFSSSVSPSTSSPVVPVAPASLASSRYSSSELATKQKALVTMIEELSALAVEYKQAARNQSVDGSVKVLLLASVPTEMFLSELHKQGHRIFQAGLYNLPTSHALTVSLKMMYKKLCGSF